MPRPTVHDGEDLTGQLAVQQGTAQGAQKIFLRFVLIALALNLLVGGAGVLYEIFDSMANTREFLEKTGDLAAGACEALRHESPRATDEEIVGRAARITKIPMALVTHAGALRFASHPALPAMAQKVYRGPPTLGTKVEIEEALGELSGAWILRPYDAKHQLLLVVPRQAEEEGTLQYMTIGAGVLGLGVALSFLIMFFTANWMLRHPLARLVDGLTGALARDVERRRNAEHVAVTARLSAEAHLAFRDNLLDATDWVGIVATDASGRVQLINRAAERILGYREAETVGGVTLAQLRDLTHRPPSQEIPLRSLMQAGPDEEFWVDKAGVEHLLALSTSDITDAEGRTNGQLVVFIDITDRKRLEVELQLNELQLIQSAKLASLGEMATGVAHELNQPLNNIGLLTSRMLKRVPDDEAGAFLREKLEKVQGQVQRASKIIDQLRSFGRPSVRKITSFPAARPVHTVLDLLGQQFTDKGIAVAVELPDGLPEVEADEAQLEQVLVNLLINARDALIEATPPGRERAVRIHAHPVEASSTAGLALCVSDNGPGIPEAVRARIFDPFFSTKEVGKGTGLGLSISYGLVSGFGGTLAVQSTAGEGTTFTITLKTAPSGHENEAPNPPR